MIYYESLDVSLDGGSVCAHHGLLLVLLREGLFVRPEHLGLREPIAGRNQLDALLNIDLLGSVDDIDRGVRRHPCLQRAYLLLIRVS